MDFNLTEEQQMLREGAERFLLENYTFDDRSKSLQSPTACNEDAWQSLADLGWLALAVPEDVWRPRGRALSKRHSWARPWAGGP